MPCFHSWITCTTSLFVYILLKPHTCDVHVVSAFTRTSAVHSKSHGYHRIVYLLKSSTADDTNDPNAKNLYDVLQLSPGATRSEIKKSYHELAKVLHPDAAMNDKGQDDFAFTELVKAYKVLYDPRERKRYDRDLRAKEITKDIESAAEGIFESILKPMFRRTAVTSSAVRNEVSSNSFKSNFTASEVTSRAKKINSKKSSSSGGIGVFNFASATFSAILAGMDAGKVVDSLELAEKAQELESMYQTEIDAAQKVREKLAAVTTERLRQSIFNPDTVLSASEAEEILENFNLPDNLSLVDALRMKNSCQQEINYLYERERELVDARGSILTSKFQNDENNSSIQRIEKYLAEARLNEQRAREALLAATRDVEAYEFQLLESKKAASVSEKREKQMRDKGLHLEDAKNRQMERVRNALKEKAQKMADEMNVDVAELFSMVIGTGESSIQLPKNLKYNDLKKLENKLVSEAVVLEARASRHLSRAIKLRDNAKGKLDDTLSKSQLQNETLYSVINTYNSDVNSTNTSSGSIGRYGFKNETSIEDNVSDNSAEKTSPQTVTDVFDFEEDDSIAKIVNEVIKSEQEQISKAGGPRKSLLNDQIPLRGPTYNWKRGSAYNRTDIINKLK